MNAIVQKGNWDRYGKHKRRKTGQRRRQQNIKSKDSLTRNGNSLKSAIWKKETTVGQTWNSKKTLTPWNTLLPSE